MLHQANDLAQRLRRARFKSGALDLDFPETKIVLDEQGKVSAIEKVENDISHQMIEEFMLLANEAVAGRLMSLRTPAIYRIHEAPSPRRLDEYREEVAELTTSLAGTSTAGPRCKSFCSGSIRCRSAPPSRSVF